MKLQKIYREAINAYTFKEENCLINNLTFYFKTLEKKRQLNPKQGEVMK